MRKDHRIGVIIPAFNEAAAIGKVLDAVPDWVDDVVVVDNGCTDATASIAAARGARVVAEARRGYGAACLKGISTLSFPDIVVFLDGDFSDYPEEMGDLVDPIASEEAELVIGSRVLGQRERGALTPQARFGNALACALMRWFWRTRHTDLGPFRAIRYSALLDLHMADQDFGWTVEMQIKAAQRGFRVLETPARYRKRIGHSKISGTLSGVLRAGTKILWTIFHAAVVAPPRRGQERVCLFSRYPEPGKAKTRLIPALGEAGAAALQRVMTEKIFAETQEVCGGRAQAELELRFSADTPEVMRAWPAPGTRCIAQGSGDLGARMARSFAEAFRAGLERVVIVGADCPALTSSVMADALDALEEHPAVIGPAEDGGYYLIALNSSALPVLDTLFRAMPWGGETVFAETCRRVETLGLSLCLLAPLRDIDTADDLHEAAVYPELRAVLTAHGYRS
jgi:rSAM/selenodomain-associated transferase 1